MTLSDASFPQPHLAQAENTAGAILFFSYILAALCMTSYVLLSIFRAQTQNSPSPKSNHARHSHGTHEGSGLVDPVHPPKAFLVFCVLAALSFTTLSWNMLNFLIVSYSRWSLAYDDPGSSSLKSVDQLWHHLYRTWTWATGSNLFQTFAEDLISEPAQWSVVRAALVYSYTWNSWMSSIGHMVDIPNLWAYFVLDQILPVSFTQNLFCMAMTQTADRPPKIERIEPDRFSILCIRLAGLFSYLTALYWIPSTVNTAQFFPTLFTLRILLLTPYLVDELGRRLPNLANPPSSLATIDFNNCLVAITFVAFASINFAASKAAGGHQTASPSSNYAAAALSNDMVVGVVGGVAFFFLCWRQHAWSQQS